MKDHDFGEIMRLCRERKGWSQAQLAKEIHIDQSLVSRIENGQAPIDLDLAVRWGEVTESKDFIAMMIAGSSTIKKMTLIHSLYSQLKSGVEMVEMTI